MDGFKMRQTAIIPSLYCNLNCKLCASAAPCYSKAASTPIDRLLKIIDRYFQVVPYVEKLAVSGGEPLLYPNLPEVLSAIEPHLSQTGSVEIITNGTIVPSGEVLEAAGQLGDKFRFMIDNYGETLSKKVPQIECALELAGIHYMTRNYTNENPHCGGWVDFGDLTEQKHPSREAAKRLYAKCAYPQKMGFCFNVVDGVMYPCSPVRRCRELGVIDEPGDYVELLDSGLSIEDQRRKIQSIYHGDSLAACAYCSGLCDDSLRFIPAEQWAPEEVRHIRAAAKGYPVFGK